MPNPTCTINSAATPADVSASSTVNGALAVPAGARFWAVVCIATDETSSVATINASLTVNQGAKTFQFTSGALGTAAIFQSTVGINGLGLDANGTVQPSYTTTFKVNVKTSGGFRVLVENETFEQNAVSGWIAEINSFIRTGGGGGGGGFTPGGDLGGTSTAQTVLALTGAAGVVAMHAATLMADQGVSTPTWSQAQQANGSAPQNWTWAPQAPGASATNATNGTPGNAIVSLASPVSGGSNPFFQVVLPGSTNAAVSVGINPTFAAPAIWLSGQVAGPNGTDYLLGTTSSLDAVFNCNAHQYFIYNGNIALCSINLDPSNLNTTFGGNAGIAGSGVGVVGFANASVAPSTAPSGGFVLYSDSGNVAYRTSSNFQMDLPSGTTTTATAGGTGALPATVLGYLVATIGGTTIKIPYYSN